MSELLEFYRNHLYLGVYRIAVQMEKDIASENAYHVNPDGDLGNVAIAERRDIALPHLLFMLDNMPDEEDTAKFNRWLGFIQGVLWMNGEFSLTQLRDQTRR